MRLETIEPHVWVFADDRKPRQGRSKKQLKPVIEHDGKVWVGYYEGRGNRVFAPSKNEAMKILRGGGA